MFVFHEPTFNALLPLFSVDDNLLRLFCLRPFIISALLDQLTIFHSFGQEEEKLSRTRVFSGEFKQERYFAGADNIIARMEPPSFYQPPLFVQPALLRRAISPSKPCKQCCARHRVTALLFSGSTASGRGRTYNPLSRPDGQLCSGRIKYIVASVLQYEAMICTYRF